MRIDWVANGGRFGSKIASANSKEGDGIGVGPVTQQVVECNDPHGGQRRVCERDMARVKVGHQEHVNLYLFYNTFFSPTVFLNISPSMKTFL